MDEFFTRLDALYEAGEPDKAESFLLDTLEELEAEGADKAAEIASVLNELGGFYRGVSRYAESMDCARRARELLASLGMADTPQYATMLLNEAGACRLMGDHGGAVDLFMQAKAMLEAQDQRESYAYVSLLNNLALEYAAQAKWDEAIPLSEAALAQVRRRPDAQEETATALTNLASMRLQAGQAEQAEALLREALDIFTAMPATDAHEAAARAALGAVQYRRGSYRDALASFRQALAGTERIFGRNVDYASALRSIAMTQAALGDRAAAADSQKQAAELLESLLGKGDRRALAYRAELRAYQTAGEAERA